MRTARYFCGKYTGPSLILAPPKEGVLALHTHCMLLLDHVPPKEPPSTTLPNALKIR